jgi:hypothetical protein
VEEQWTNTYRKEENPREGVREAAKGIGRPGGREKKTGNGGLGREDGREGCGRVGGEEGGGGDEIDEDRHRSHSKRIETNVMAHSSGYAGRSTNQSV